MTKVVKVGWLGPSVSLLCASPLTKRDVRVTFIFLRAGSAEEKLDILVGEDINCHLRIMIMMLEVCRDERFGWPHILLLR